MFDVNKIVLTRKKKSHNIAYEGTKLTLKNIMASCPFGIENYKSKQIINLNLNNNNNENYNNLVQIKVIESFFEKEIATLLNKNPELEILLNNHDFSPCVKSNNYLRLHMKNTKIFIKQGDQEYPAYSIDLKGMKIKADITLGELWYYEGKYGLVWNLDKIVII
jgi:hypothetical protein